MHSAGNLTLAALLAAVLSPLVLAESSPGLPAPSEDVESAFPKRDHYSPYAGRNFPTTIYWGDSHLHTGMSMDAAEKYDDPGRFTAFIGYEWTSNKAGDNRHRVLIYRDGAERASRVEPYTTLPPLGSPNEGDLWAWMSEYEEKSGGDILAIAHNGNLSNGVMFPVVSPWTGKKVDKTYVESRARWEPLYEATQIKGDGEAHPFLSPDDEFADYETWDQGNLDLSTLKEKEMLQYEYARSALKIGLQLEEELGTNPYKFGLIGATDSHTGLATAQEDNYRISMEKKVPMITQERAYTSPIWYTPGS